MRWQGKRNVYPSGPRGLECANQAELVQLVSQVSCEPDDVGEWNSRPWVQINGRRVRVFEVLNSRLPGVYGDGADLDRVEERQQIAANDALRPLAIAGRHDGGAQRFWCVST